PTRLPAGRWPRGCCRSSATTDKPCRAPCWSIAPGVSGYTSWVRPPGRTQPKAEARHADAGWLQSGRARTVPMASRINWFKYASPVSFYPLAGRLLPWFALAAAVLAASGLYVGLVVAPSDYVQGDAYRIIFIHVPAAWMSMFIYGVMAGYAILTLALRTRLSAMMMQALAPTGALFTFLAL